MKSSINVRMDDVNTFFLEVVANSICLFGEINRRFSMEFVAAFLMAFLSCAGHVDALNR